MRQLESDLWRSTVHRSGILSTHAYFLERRDGNVLFYNIVDDRDLDRIADLGGIRYPSRTPKQRRGARGLMLARWCAPGGVPLAPGRPRSRLSSPPSRLRTRLVGKAGRPAAAVLGPLRGRRTDAGVPGTALDGEPGLRSA